MENIILVTGNAKFPITIDPGVWIFDDRRIDLTTYFLTKRQQVDELEEYKKAVSKHWDREIMEGAVFPPTLKTEKVYEKVKVLTGTFGIPLKPFLLNSEPNEGAQILLIQSKDGDIEVSLQEAYEMILGFSENGQPLTTDGPVHVYYGDGRNRQNPIKNVTAFILK